jgi:hypothetical protein
MNNKKKQKSREIKEYHISKLIDCIDCIDNNPFNRERQRDCILNLYPQKGGKGPEHLDKSIFRGMVIPSLKYLGLIRGEGDFIRASANGKLIIQSRHISHDLHHRVLSAVFYEIDKNKLRIIEEIRNFSPLTMKNLIILLNDEVDAFSDKSRQAIVRKWVALFKQANLIRLSSKRILPKEEDIIVTNDENLQQVLLDIDVKSKNLDAFKKYFFDSYFGLAKDSAGVVDIEDLREKVSLKMLEKYLILTENQFDIMLSNIPFETSEYIISLGKPMHARNKLFKYGDNYYRTIFVKLIKKGHKNGNEQ